MVLPTALRLEALANDCMELNRSSPQRLAQSTRPALQGKLLQPTGTSLAGNRAGWRCSRSVGTPARSNDPPAARRSGCVRRRCLAQPTSLPGRVRSCTKLDGSCFQMECCAARSPHYGRWACRSRSSRSGLPQTRCSLDRSVLTPKDLGLVRWCCWARSRASKMVVWLL